MPTPKPPYTAAFREQIVELARAGRGLRELGREFGVSVNSIREWVKRERAGGDGVAAGRCAGAARVLSDAPLSASERQELQELRRRLRQVQMERDILAKATAWFAGKSEKTSITSTNS